ncbi:MAG: hypothetical protein J0H08_05075 [Rhizobiales bacterium]|nr:hypothetical protein [Hyphomicrobiales bacterium]
MAPPTGIRLQRYKGLGEMDAERPGGDHARPPVRTLLHLARPPRAGRGC